MHVVALCLCGLYILNLCGLFNIKQQYIKENHSSTSMSLSYLMVKIKFSKFKSRKLDGEDGSLVSFRSWSNHTNKA